jgi:hypothetical protein
MLCLIVSGVYAMPSKVLATATCYNMSCQNHKCREGMGSTVITQNYQGIIKNGTLRAEFEISAQPASAAWLPNNNWSLRQLRLPNLMGSAEFEKYYILSQTRKCAHVVLGG